MAPTKGRVAKPERSRYCGPWH